MAWNGTHSRGRNLAKFYISSTFVDLQDCREAVYRTLRRMGHDAIAMEDYVAADNRPKDKCVLDVQSADVYRNLCMAQGIRSRS
jgi:hypothetical protein